MCENENVKIDRMKCEACRTINLAKHSRHPKPDMQVYNKCTPAPGECIPVSELPLHPTCIKVCSREEYKMRKSGKKIVIPQPPVAHGKLMYAVKAGLLVGAVYFTYTQGVWGDQQDVIEATRRWQEYVRSINTRRPPTFDQCGKVVTKESSDSIVAPIYTMYKALVTTCFSGVVKFPQIVKCLYLDYQKGLEAKSLADQKEKNIKKKSI